MGFWGLELKPGNPYTHVYDEALGKLRITQATLGHGTITKRSFVQCKVGSKNPVLLCSLLLDKVESCSLNLEFQEQDKVVFSVIGPTSVHLSGYYSVSADSCNDDQADYHGIYIGESESEESNTASEDSYDRDFINDGDIEFSPPSSRRAKRGQKSTNKPRKSKRIDKGNDHVVPERKISVKRKCISENEDEDEFTVSNFFAKKYVTEDSKETKNSNVLIKATIDSERKSKKRKTCKMI